MFKKLLFFNTLIVATTFLNNLNVVFTNNGSKYFDKFVLNRSYEFSTDKKLLTYSKQGFVLTFGGPGLDFCATILELLKK